MTVAEIADHEAAHAAAGALLGLPIAGLTVEPDDRFAGRTDVAYGDSVIDALKRMQIILAGLLESGDAPTWPLQSRTTDEANLRGIADRLGLDAAGYERVLDQTRALTKTTRFRRLKAGIASMAEFTPRLDCRALDRLIGDLMDDTTIDDLLAEVELNEAARGRYKAITRPLEHYDAAFHEMLKGVEAKALKAHRLAAESFEIKSFLVGE